MRMPVSIFPAGLSHFQQFGEYGPVYEILECDEARSLVRIRVLHSGEELDYPMDRALEDPEAETTSGYRLRRE